MINTFAKALGVCILLMCTPFYSNASHITGGEFTLRHLEGNTFEASLTLYRDCFSGGANFDQILEITVFDALTNEHLNELDFVFNGFELLTPPAVNPCFALDLCTEIGLYQTQIELPDNPNGYYLTKERCCRNALSINLAGNELGFVFTLDLPDPLFENSTPQFNQLSDAVSLCVNQENLIDFGATDIDGDSLSYSFTDPLNGESSFFNPDPSVASAKPYSTVPWAAGFSINSQIGGLAPMTINSETGLISAQPDQIGIFTTAVKVDEFRNGILIGTIRREFQIVSGVCVTDSPPLLNTPNGDTIFDVFANTETCIPISVSDINAGDSLTLFGEGSILNGSVTPLAIFPDASGFETIEQDFCWTPVCENSQEDPYLVTLTALSEGCSEVITTQQNIYFNITSTAAQFSFEENDLSISFTDESVGASSWFWEFGDGNSSIEQNPSHTYASPGTYSVILTVDNECSLTLEIQVGTTSINEVQSSRGFTVYPNPTSGRIRIDNKEFGNDQLEVRIYDTNGKLLRSTDFLGDQMPLNLRNFNSGIHFILIFNSDDGRILFRNKLTITE